MSDKRNTVRGAQSADGARERVNKLIGTAEDLIGTQRSLRRAHASTHPIIEKVIELAARDRAARFTQGSRSAGRSRLGRPSSTSGISPIAGTNPQQAHDPLRPPFTDRVLPEVPGSPYSLSTPRIVFCAAVDRAGFLPHATIENSPSRSAADVCLEYRETRAIGGSSTIASGLAAGRNTEALSAAELSARHGLVAGLRPP